MKSYNVITKDVVYATMTCIYEYTCTDEQVEEVEKRKELEDSNYVIAEYLADITIEKTISKTFEYLDTDEHLSLTIEDSNPKHTVFLGDKSFELDVVQVLQYKRYREVLSTLSKDRELINKALIKLLDLHG